MAAVTRTDHPTSGNEYAGLSDYEKLRLKKIKRNEDRMKELGLFQSRDAILASAKKKKAAKRKTTNQISPQLPQRRSSRKRSAVVDYNYEQVIPMYEDDEDKANEEEEASYSDEKIGSNDEGEEDDFILPDEEEEIEAPDPPKKRLKPIRPSKVSKAIDTSFGCANSKGGLTLEFAKTGRSSCRSCLSKIEKGAPRVGMEAWIVGRNAITWQTPKCLLQNMVCLYEKSGGKGKCKATHVPFEKGNLKVGIRCHTATSYYSIEAIEGVLSNVVALMRTDESMQDFQITVDDIVGNEKLAKGHRQVLEDALEIVFRQIPEDPKLTVSSSAILDEAKFLTSTAVKTVKNEVVSKPLTLEPQKRDQPKSGAKTGAKGKVEWKFGGRFCYGTLIPKMESKTHCFARTHKGNVKTLAKGKAYWSMLE